MAGSRLISFMIHAEYLSLRMGMQLISFQKKASWTEGGLLTHGEDVLWTKLQFQVDSEPTH